MPSPTQSDPAVEALPAVRPAGRLSIDKRASITLARFLVILCIGVSVTLGWQSYGGPVREMIASSYPQLSWLMPQAEPAPQNAPDVSSRTASSPDQRQSNGVTLDLDAVRQAIDRIATSIASSQEQITSNADRSATNQEQMMRSLDRITTNQEQVMRSLDRITASQEQMTHEITKLQEIEQSNSSRNLVPSPRPVTSAPMPIPRPVVSAPKALPRPASAPAAQPLSQASQEPTVR